MPQILERDVIDFRPDVAVRPAPPHVRLPVVLPDLAQRYQSNRYKHSFAISVAFHGLWIAVGLFGTAAKADYGMSAGRSGLIAIEMVDSLPSTPMPQVAKAIPPPEPQALPEDVALKTQTAPETPTSQEKPSAPQMASMPSASKSIGDGGAMLAQPSYYSNPPPPYPMQARQQRQQGRVLLEVHVNKQGRPDGVRIKESSGFPLLDTAALSAVQKWRFKPARLAGLIVETVVEVPIRFELKTTNV